MVIRLYGVECHECGQHAAYWTDGVTLPCRCGALSLDEATAAFDRVTEDSRQRRAEAAAL